MHVCTNLNCIIILITFGYLGFIILWVSRKLDARSIQKTDDFFSYPTQDSLLPTMKLLERTFEATNASFTTAFLGLFALAILNSLYTFSIIVGYILGIVFFAKKLLIKCMPFIKNQKFYPFVLEDKTGDKYIRFFSVIIIILSLLFFYFTEVYGFSVTFLGGSGTLTLNQFFITSMFLILILGWYVTIGGYKSVIITDCIQLTLIRLGFSALFVLTIILLFIYHSSILRVLKTDFSQTSIMILIPCIIIGFLFSQLIYYDNWQRLILLFKSIKSDEDISHKIIEKQYVKASGYLFIYYLIALSLGIICKAAGYQDLFNFFNELFQQNIYYKVIITLSILAFISALLSTVDTYILGCLQILYNNFKIRNLVSIRKSAFIFSVMVIPFIILKIDLGSWFKFLFYSANGLVGPVLGSLYKEKLNKYVTYIVIVVGVVSSVLFMNSPYIDIINASIVIFSIALTFAIGS